MTTLTIVLLALALLLGLTALAFGYGNPRVTFKEAHRAAKAARRGQQSG